MDRHADLGEWSEGVKNYTRAALLSHTNEVLTKLELSAETDSTKLRCKAAEVVDDNGNPISDWPPQKIAWNFSYEVSKASLTSAPKKKDVRSYMS